jgi:hypothetical protein
MGRRNSCWSWNSLRTHSSGSNCSRRVEEAVPIARKIAVALELLGELGGRGDRLVGNLYSDEPPALV